MLPTTVRSGATLHTVARWRERKPKKPPPDSPAHELPASELADRSAVSALRPVRVHLGVVGHRVRVIEEVSCVLIPALLSFIVNRDLADEVSVAESRGEADLCGVCGCTKGLQPGRRDVPVASMTDIDALFMQQKGSCLQARRGCILFCLPPVSAVVLPESVVFDINEQVAVDTMIEELERAAVQCFGSPALAGRRRGSAGDQVDFASHESFRGRQAFPFEAASLSVLSAVALDALDDEVADVVGSVVWTLRSKQNWERDASHELLTELRRATDDLERIYRNLSAFVAEVDALRAEAGVELQISMCATDPLYQTRSDPCHQKSQARDDMSVALGAVWTRASDAKRRLLLTRAAMHQLSLKSDAWQSRKLDRVIWFEALFACTGLAFSTGIVLFGLYGMNLKNGLEDSRAAFTVVWSTGLAGAALCIMFFSGFLVSNRAA